MSFFLLLPFLLLLGKTCFQEGDPRAMYHLLKMLSLYNPTEKAEHSGGVGVTGERDVLAIKVLAGSSSALGCVATSTEEFKFTE